jgi:hypothetical protein
VDKQWRLTRHEHALVAAVTASLKPILVDLCQRLDTIDEHIRAIMHRQRLTRPKPHTMARPCTRARPQTRTCREFRRY